MASKLLALVAITSTSASATGGTGREPLVLKPTSAWHVTYEDDRCRLAREFGEAEEKVFAIFDRYGPGEGFDLTLAGKPVKTSLSKAEAVVQFGPTEEEQQLLFLNGNVGEMPALIFTGGARVAPPTAAEKLAAKSAKFDNLIDVAPIGEARQKAIKYLKIGKPIRRSVTMETGSMRAPLAALDKCIDDLLTQWGIDIEKHKFLTRGVTPTESPGDWVVSSDYPLKMLRAGQPALVQFRLSVGPDGVPTACHIQSTTRPKEFDSAVCKSLMRRARFKPALDADGKPLASYWRSAVRFEIPDPREGNGF